MFELRGVTKDFPLAGGLVPALDHIDLVIPAQAFTVVTGPSGSGKSTLLNILGTLDVPTEGSITFEGRELTGLPDRELSLIRRRRIGFVFQFFNLLPNLATWHNIAMPLLLDGVSAEWSRQRVASLADELGIARRLDVPARLLSGGEIQRAAIARALVTDPAVILADEPTASLDPALTTGIMDILKSINGERGLTLVVSQHQLETALTYASRIVGFRAGRVAFDGPPSAVTPVVVEAIYGEAR